MIGVLLLGGSLLSGAPADAADVKPIANLGVSSTDRLAVVSSTHRLISLGGNNGEPLQLTVFDTHTFRRIRSVEHAGYFPQPQATNVPRVFALDEASRLLHIVVFSNPRDQANSTSPKLLSVNIDTLAVVGSPKDLGIFPPGVRFYGAATWGPHRLGLIGQLATDPAVGTNRPPSPPLFGVLVGEIDPATGEAAWGPTPVRGCQKVISTHDQAALPLYREHVFLACGTGNAGIFTAPGTPAVVGIDVANPLEQRYLPLPGSYATGDSLVDPVAQRLLLVGRTGDRPSQSVWVFDLEHEVFVGQVAAGDYLIRGAGVDPATGLLYITIGLNDGSGGALLVARDRGIEIPQARAFELNAELGPLIPIPTAGAVIVPIDDGEGSLLRVIRAPLPAEQFAESHPVDVTSYDGLTSEGPEFAGDVQSFGVRVHQIGGIGAAIQNIFYGDNSALIAGTGLKDGDRDLYLARVLSTHLSQDEASAAAIAADRDANTNDDYRTIAGMTGELVSPEWPYQGTECSDFGSGSEPPPVDDAEVACKQMEGRAEGKATYVGLPAGLISVVSASSTGTVYTDPALGLVAEASAEVRNVVIGDAVTISRITSGVRVTAKGGARSAVATYSRSFEGVTAGGFSCGSQCDPRQVLEAISETLGLQFRVELPAADVLTTPGGSHAHAVREAWQHKQDVVLTNQDPTELQIPALRVTYIGDNAVASRAIVEFAGISAIATDLRVVPGSPAVEPPSVVLPPLPSVAPVPEVPGIDAPPAARPDPVKKVVRVLGRSWGLTFALGHRSVALWMLMAVPLFLLARRRQLLRVARR